MSGEQLLGIAAIISAIAGPLSLVLIARIGQRQQQYAETFSQRQIALADQLAKANIDNLQATANVQREVQTINAQSLAQLADAQETRRVRNIPEGERTSVERGHMEAAEEE